MNEMSRDQLLSLVVHCIRKLGGRIEFDPKEVEACRYSGLYVDVPAPNKVVIDVCTDPTTCSHIEPKTKLGN